MVHKIQFPPNNTKSQHNNIFNVAGDIFSLRTGGGYLYDNQWMAIRDNQCYFEFSAKACEDLKVALVSDPEQLLDENVLEVTIRAMPDGSTQTVTELKQGINGTLLAYVETPSLLSCFELQPLWVGWCEGTITIGKDEPYTNKVLEHVPADFPHIAMISISSNGVTHWEYLREQGEWTY